MKREKNPRCGGPTGSRAGRIHPGRDGLDSPRFHGRSDSLPEVPCPVSRSLALSLGWYQLLPPLRQLEHKFRSERGRARRTGTPDVLGESVVRGARRVGEAWRAIPSVRVLFFMSDAGT